MNKLLTTALLFLLGTALVSCGSYEDCVIDGMNGVSSDLGAVEVENACRDKFSREISSSAPNHVGWTVENSGMGRCHLIWDGAKFVETKLRKAPQDFGHFEVGLPRQFKLSLYIPNAIPIIDDPSDEQSELRQIVKMFGTWPLYFCGKSSS